MKHHPRPRLKQPLVLLALPLACVAQLACAQAGTPTTTLTNQITITATSTVVRPWTAPLLMGFNVSWWGFQLGPNYDSSAGPLWAGAPSYTPRPALVNFLQADFAGALYRYHGMDYFEWSKTVGPQSSRAMQRSPWGSGSFQVQFGVDEFMRFVSSVRGQALIQLCLNQYNADGSPIMWSSVNDWARLKQDVIGYMEYVNGPVYTGTGTGGSAYDWNGDGVVGGNLRKANGRPDPYNVALWELGNEMELIPDAPLNVQRKSTIATTTYGPSPTSGDDPRPVPMIDRNEARDRYAARITELAGAMRQAVNGSANKAALSPLILIPHAATGPWATPQADYDWKSWHVEAWKRAGLLVDGLAFHAYYDGGNVSSMNSFQDTIRAGTASVIPNKPAKIYVTEHARWPWGDSVPGGYERTKTTDRSATLSIADYVISQQQRPEVASAITHELGNGPWNLFSGVDANGYVVTTDLRPRPLAYGLQLLHRSFRDSDILSTTVAAPNTSAYGYDSRAAAYKAAGGQLGVVTVNRAAMALPVSLTLPSTPPADTVVKIEGVSGGSLMDSIWTRYVPVRLAGRAISNLVAPAHSVTNIRATEIPSLTINGDFESGSPQPLSWEARADSGTTCVMSPVSGQTAWPTVSGTTVLRLERTKGSGGCMQAQPGWLNASLNGTGSALWSARTTDHKLRAYVRTSDPANVSVRLQFFDATGAYVPNSPSATPSVASAVDGWMPVELTFRPATIVGGKGFKYAEILIVNRSSQPVDVDAVTLTKGL